MAKGYTLKNNIPRFLTTLAKNKTDALDAMGKFCKGKMDSYVPVDTGKLKSKNDYETKKDTVILKNDCEYAGFQEFGTSRQQGTPFIRPAVFNHIGELGMIARGKLKNGID